MSYPFISHEYILFELNLNQATRWLSIIGREPNILTGPF